MKAYNDGKEISVKMTFDDAAITALALMELNQSFGNEKALHIADALRNPEVLRNENMG
ncbi:hypothetical protein HNR44_001561 [Geomicrobium halophilum]|uniref:Uncharacterized protein n=1 Tax=Geomicrobium halophilum TaxID=549000 RepID=A0A841PYU2_9BACL|nr:hypothetical protein [Geomicrobium halophilum]MBB6449612.1 hypothetical protein [Geomicrobium halophilum]